MQKIATESADVAHDQQLPTSHYVEHFIPPSAMEAVEALWSCHVYLDGRQAVVPDGRMDLFASWSVDDQGRLSSPAIRMCGPSARLHFVDGSAKTVWMGLRFQLGWGGCALGVSAKELVDRIDPAPTLPPELEAGVSGVLASASFEEALARWDEVALAAARLARRRVDSMPEWGAMHAVLSAARAGAEPLHHQVPERTMRRHVLKHVGLPLRTVQAVCRFQRALRLLKGPVPMSLAAIAHEAGYADQSHMTRDFKRFGGFLPTRPLDAPATWRH